MTLIGEIPFKIVLTLDFPLVLFLVGNPDELTKPGRFETKNSVGLRVSPGQLPVGLRALPGLLEKDNS